ncbi:MULTISPECIES: NfeD family protein [Bartonella]|uniref:NfeD family protein n=1 Tax=Bartonella TaxID=773 RepID=UPI0018DC9123|nr:MULTISPECIES: NfeD family protein [Bartonella]MBH9974245.1 NfeD family protein [Bartonella choladocola]MBI0013852.1 NfeD family protein [Bartonella sp. B10834G3]
MFDLLMTLGAWNWVVLGFVLLLLELIFPGVFFVWFGLGALLTALVSLLFYHLPWVASWEVEVIFFLIFSIIMVLIGRNFFRRDRETDEPLLNRRTDQIIGKRVVLEEPVRDGKGRIRVDDTIWRIKGPDLPEGTEVKVVAFENGVFTIEKA